MENSYKGSASTTTMNLFEQTELRPKRRATVLRTLMKVLKFSSPGDWDIPPLNRGLRSDPGGIPHLPCHSATHEGLSTSPYKSIYAIHLIFYYI